MSDLRQAQATTIADAAWQLVYRIGFPLAQIVWRLSRRRHEGALIAVVVGDSLLVLRSSYRTAWNFPGGTIQRNETPEAAARRELAEEIAITTDQRFQLVATLSGVWDGRRDRVHMFEVRLDCLPPLRLDNREIIGARLVPWADVATLPLTEPVRRYLTSRASAIDSCRTDAV